ncbi:MAG TPA: FoF1 ATP synthase subunit gamma, partial [Myxococcota bacterium]|nr:FoF1 ATP synthase subunit gamma [Myxococcota bacterium]
ASALSQTPRVVTLLPPRIPKTEDTAPFDAEPDLGKLLALLVPKTFEVAIHRALLESEAGEHGARMTAMEAATRNGEEMITSLTLRFNHARQAAITRELVEIITGAEAL